MKKYDLLKSKSLSNHKQIFVQPQFA